MHLTSEENDMLSGLQGRATQKAMQILAALGEIYAATRCIPVSSVQVAGVSYDNLGEAGLAYLSEMADGGGRVRVPTTLNPAGMDIENWRALGIPPDFAENQHRVLQAFSRMGVTITCTCTPYLVGNLPGFGEHIAWSESSAVCYANSVLGARTNREGGPSALASALTGRTPEYGFHLPQKRLPELTFEVQDHVSGTFDFGALGKVIGEHIQGTKAVPFITGVQSASLEELKSFSASLATFGGAALFHMAGITPEAAVHTPPDERIHITRSDLDAAAQSLTDGGEGEIDFVSLGCPHLSIAEIEHLARLLKGKQVKKEFWITTARATKNASDQLGYTAIIEPGADSPADTCCVVPLSGRFTVMATISARPAIMLR
jgi:predicted aconitase